MAVHDRTACMYLQALWVDLPQETLDFLLNLPPPVHGEGEDDGHEEECAQDARGDLGPAARPLALRSVIAAVGLVHGPELVRPVDVQPRDVGYRPRRGGVTVLALVINARRCCVGVIVEIPDFDEEVAALEPDLPRDGAFVGVVVLFQREGGEVSLGVAVGIDVNGILKILRLF